MNTATLLPRTIWCAAFSLLLGTSAPALAQLQVLISPTDPELTGKYFGETIGVIRDVEEDGKDDFFVTAPGDWEPGTRSSRLYVFSGATRQIIRTLRPPNVPGPLVWWSSAAALWDSNLDGRGDIAIASSEPSPSGGMPGVARVYSGATGELITIIGAADQGPWGCGGGAVHALPDLNGDGRSDVGLNYEGMCDYFTRFYSVPTGSVLYEPQSYHSGSPYVSVVRQMPDLDGDSIAELALGTGGRVYIVSGATGALIRQMESPIAGGGLANAPNALDTVQDIDGDGVPDLLVGSPMTRSEPDAPARSGVAYIFSGGTGELIHTIPPPVPRYFANFAHTVTAIPDIDGDGRGDIVIGTYSETPPGGLNREGAAYVFSGGTGQLLRSFNSPNPQELGRFGSTVSSFPEWRPSRRATIAIAAPNEWGNRGRVYLYAACKADADANGIINSQDITRFINGWLMTIGTPPGTLPPPGVHHGDYDGDGAVTSRDIAAFITDWVVAVQQNGCP